SETPSARESLLPAIRSAWSELESSLEQARRSRDAGDLHAFRIAAKRLRYRIETARDLCGADFRDVLRWLKELQEGLGAWHDRRVLHQMTAEALARPEILVKQSEAARLILGDLEKELRADVGAMEEIFRLATDHSARSRFTERLGR
ncbi:MAG: CHAD domain-containing protein, partial [Candidatus Binatia bacterium]